MKLAIIGSRTFTNYQLLEDKLSSYYFGGITDDWLIYEIISGGAAGADSMGAKFAKEQNIKLTEFLPDWKTHGKAAGFIRNEDIIKNCDEVIAFWDGISRGTQNSLSIAKRLKKPTIVIYF